MEVLENATPEPGQRVHVRLNGDHEIHTMTYEPERSGFAGFFGRWRNESGSLDAFRLDEWEPAP